MEKLRKYEWVLIPLLLIVAAFFCGDYYGQRKVENSLESKTDTITKIVPIYKDFPDPVASASVGFIPIPAYAFITDTVTQERIAVIHDPTPVYLPREQKYYEEDEGRLRLWVSGYDTRLDRYELDHVENVVTNTVIVPPKKFSLGISGGFGAMFPKKTVSYFPYAELNASYAITDRWKIGVSGGYEVPIVDKSLVPSPFVKISGTFTILSL